MALGLFSHWRCLLFLSISFSPLLLPKPSLFPHTTKLVSEKWRSRTHSQLDCREIWAPGSELIFKHYHHWELWKHVGTERNTLCIVAFSFPAETQNCLSKTTIRIRYPLDFREILIRGSRFSSAHLHHWDLKIMSVEVEILITHRQWNKGFNPFFSLTLENSIKTIRGKAWGISRNH